MTKITIEVYSDTVCPFCYIGAKSLEAAIASFTQSRRPGDDDQAEFVLVWRPFLIHPKFRGGIPDKAGYFRAKYGPGGADAFFERMGERGRRLGIGFRWDGRSGSSWDSHKLMLRALDGDRAEEVEEEERGEEG
ncbi:hypothetical protein NKR19_g1289, partial [Coniochaeta hoffmannii]